MNNIELEAGTIFENMPDNSEILLQVNGISMQPFLKNGKDFVYLKKPASKIKKGDIIVFKRASWYIMHRVVDIDRNGILTTMGDYTYTRETGIKPENVKAVVTAAVIDGRKIDRHSPRWIFYSKIFIFPFVRKLIGKVK